MTCVCGQTMCYICRVPVKSYEHFHQGNTAATDASVRGKCPLWTDTVKIDTTRVREAAESAAKAVVDDALENGENEALQEIENMKKKLMQGL